MKSVCLAFKHRGWTRCFGSLFLPEPLHSVVAPLKFSDYLHPRKRLASLMRILSLHRGDKSCVVEGQEPPKSEEWADVHVLNSRDGKPHAANQ